ncbi:hypothetical protein ACFYRL_30180 [Streptomyces goshikiensis]|uniref:hypothetical protein n=1 Tax=Streptomyces goshikiensis TaxID=1942 RepID=UPI0036BAE95D
MSSGADRHNDALADWLHIRTEISWQCWSSESAIAARPLTPDGFRNFFTVTRGARAPEVMARALTALDVVFSDAQQSARLTFPAMANWQRTVLHRKTVAFRTMPAFVKGGGESYGLSPGTPAHIAQCLAESSSLGVPLPSRAARSYLDLRFFHPFEDGNARAAMLAGLRPGQRRRLPGRRTPAADHPLVRRR